MPFRFLETSAEVVNHTVVSGRGQVSLTHCYFHLLHPITQPKEEAKHSVCSLSIFTNSKMQQGSTGTTVNTVTNLCCKTDCVSLLLKEIFTYSCWTHADGPLVVIQWVVGHGDRR